MSLHSKSVAVHDFKKHDFKKYDFKKHDFKKRDSNQHVSQHGAQKVTLKEVTRPAEETEHQ